LASLIAGLDSFLPLYAKVRIVLPIQIWTHLSITNNLVPLL
jgi:hypothetical protein